MSPTRDRPRRVPGPSSTHRDVLQRGLLTAGIAYGVTYVVANDVVAAQMWENYSRLDQAISELSGTGAPSRGFLAAMLPVFTLLVIAFGVGVCLAAGPSRPLRWTGGILIAQGLVFPVWLLFPMTSRAELARGAGGVNDRGHLVLGALSILLILAEMGLSAAALDQRFRFFSIAVAVTVVAAGGYVSSMTSAVSAGAPTPWMGFVERISYGAWLLWMAVLAVVLLRRSDSAAAPADA